MRFSSVDADTENHCVRRVILGEVALKVAGLECAPTRKVLRIKVEHHPLAFEISEAHLLAFVACKIKCRRRGSYCRQFIDCANTAATDHGRKDEHEKKCIL